MWIEVGRWTYANGLWLRVERLLAPEANVRCPAAGRRGLGIGLYAGAVCADTVLVLGNGVDSVRVRV